MSDSSSEIPVIQKIGYGETVNLNPNPFIREGFGFKGWGLTENGAVKYADQAPFTMVKNTDLYALWSNSKEGLVAYYPFADTPYDYSDNLNNPVEIKNITYANGVSTGTDKNGAVPDCAVFNGTSSYMVVPYSKSIILNTNVSALMWFKPTTLTSCNLILIYNSKLNKIVFAISIDPEKNTFKITEEVSASVTSMSSLIRLNAWNHIAITIKKLNDTNSFAKIFVNGELVASKQFKTVTIDTSCYYDIGVWGKSTLKGFYKGNISELRIYKRCLDDDEIKALMQLYQVDYKPNQLMAYFPLKMNNLDSSRKDDYPVPTNKIVEENNVKFRNINAPEHFEGSPFLSRALYFAGNNGVVTDYKQKSKHSYLITNDSASLHINRHHYSGMLWIYPIKVSWPWLYILTKGQDSPNTGSDYERSFLFSFNYAKSTVTIGEETGDGGQLSDITLPTLNKWNHVAFTSKWDELQKTLIVSYYLNGVLIKTGKPIKANYLANSTKADWMKLKLMIGYDPCSNTESSNCYMRELKLYNRVITPEEILADYNNKDPWLIEYCTITFDANGGSGTMEPFNFVFSSTDPLPENKFTNSGYIFKEWNDPVSGKNYKDKEFVNFTSNRTLKAVWTRIKYNCTFHNADDTKTATQEFDYTNAQSLTLINDITTFIRPKGKKFIGWATSKNGSKVYNDGQTISLTKNIDLYAVYDYKTLTVRLNKNDGTDAAVEKKLKFSETFTFPSDDVKGSFFYRNRYKLLNWNTQDDGKGTTFKKNYTKSVIEDVEESEALNYYAQWQLWKFTVRYNNEKAYADDTEFYRDELKALHACSFKKEGFDFLGWSKSSSATTVNFQDQESIIINDEIDITETNILNLYAVWKQHTITIQFNKNDTQATGSVSSITANAVINNEVSLPSLDSFKKSGWYIKEWNTKADGSGRQYTDKYKIDSNKDHTITLYAIWVACDVAVAYDNNNGFVKPNNFAVVFDGK